jgi:hypothetical protein
MYGEAFYEGDQIHQPLVFGVLENSTEVSILPEDLGLDFWLFSKGFVHALLYDDHEQICPPPLSS